ncbi:MAG: glycosyltransferase family 4 protein [Candidatus Helarchaeota archaeon]
MNRICIVTGIFPPDIGGPATYCFNLKKSLEHLGFQITIITFKDPNIRIKKHKTIKRINRNLPIPVKMFMAFFLALVNVRKYSIIFANDTLLTGVPAILISKLFKKKLLFKLTGDFVWETLRRYNWISDDINKFQSTNYSFQIQVLKTIQRICCKFPSKIIVPCKYLKKMISNWGISKKKIKVIFNSINIKNQKLNKKFDFERGPDEIILLSVSRLVNTKRFDIIIKGFSYLNSNYKLLIVGDGPDYPKLVNLARNTCNENRIIFLGKLEHDILLDLYSKVDILILLSDYEGYSHVLIEGLIKKTNIIASNIGGNSEIIKNKVNGILINNDPKELKQAILDIINKKIILRPEFSFKWSWQDLLQKTIRLFSML